MKREKIGLLKETWASGSIVKQSGTAAEFLAKYLIDRKETDGLNVLYKIHNMGEDGLGYRYVTGPTKPEAIRGKFYSGVPLERIEEIKNGTSLKFRPIVNYYDYSGDFGNIRKEGGIAFNSGKKPIKMLQHLIFTANLNPGDIVMDFFSGSASTAHAVMQYSAENSVPLKYIMVQYPEELSEKDDLYREGYRTICDIGKARIKSSASMVKSTNPLFTQSLDNGFRVLKIDDSNMNDVYYSPAEYSQDLLSMLESNVKSDRNDLDLLFGCLLEWGLPLSLPYCSETIDGCTIHNYNDADIFKAKIYNQLEPEDKKAFIERWKDLDEQATDANESIQQLFYYNMFYYRALEKDTKTTTPGVRKYYAANKFERLYKPELIDTLFVILNLWKVVNKGEEIEGEAWSKNMKIKQTLDTLSSYPNEFWKYPVVIYYICYRNEENFEVRFALFLNKLLMELMTKYLMIPTINAVKPDILKLNSAIVASDVPTFEFKNIDLAQLEPYIQNPNRNAVRMLLKTLAYEQQDELLPAKWEIEHIFPQKWQTNYFPDESDETIKEKIEHIGNKLPFEKKLNIVAGNGYFAKKKKEYTASKIAITNAMGISDVQDWNMDSIMKRDIRISDEIIKILNRWNNEYLNIPVEESEAEEPSEEDLARIEEFKKKGWI